MIDNIIGLIACIMCSLPFLIIGHFGKTSQTPLAFWSGDNSLKDKITDLPAYNAEMSGLYIKWGLSYLITGIACLFHMVLGLLLLAAECTVGIYLVYRCYKKILGKYSD